jgi:hypothetical protein
MGWFVSGRIECMNKSLGIFAAGFEAGQKFTDPVRLIFLKVWGGDYKCAFAILAAFCRTCGSEGNITNITVAAASHVMPSHEAREIA